VDFCLQVTTVVGAAALNILLVDSTVPNGALLEAVSVIASADLATLAVVIESALDVWSKAARSGKMSLNILIVQLDAALILFIGISAAIFSVVLVVEDGLITMAAAFISIATVVSSISSVAAAISSISSVALISSIPSVTAVVSSISSIAAVVPVLRDLGSMAATVLVIQLIIDLALFPPVAVCEAGTLLLEGTILPLIAGVLLYISDDASATDVIELASNLLAALFGYLLLLRSALG